MNLAVFADGGSRGNPGPAAFGYVVYELKTPNTSPAPFVVVYNPNPSKQGTSVSGEFFMKEIESGNIFLDQILEEGKYLGETTNNQAEWQGVLYGVKKITEKYDLNNVQNLSIFLDSELVVKQVRGIYKVKKPELKPFHQETLSLLKNFKSWSIYHIKRNFNKEADRVVNEVLDGVV
jgi:ribonuclease HI